MKGFIVIVLIMVSGCASVPPVWQQELNNINRQWRDYSTPIIQPNAGVKRPQTKSINVCSF